jgi:hypothetical protein
VKNSPKNRKKDKNLAGTRKQRTKRKEEGKKVPGTIFLRSGLGNQTTLPVVAGRRQAETGSQTGPGQKIFAVNGIVCLSGINP